MSNDFFVRPAALRTDSTTWTGWQEDLVATAEAIPLIGNGLDALAFSGLPGGPEVAAVYSKVSGALKEALDKGATQFAGFATKLRTVADSYDGAEQLNIDDIAQATTEVDAL